MCSIFSIHIFFGSETNLVLNVKGANSGEFPVEIRIDKYLGFFSGLCISYISNGQRRESFPTCALRPKGKLFHEWGLNLWAIACKYCIVRNV